MVARALDGYRLSTKQKRGKRSPRSDEWLVTKQVSPPSSGCRSGGLRTKARKVRWGALEATRKSQVTRRIRKIKNGEERGCPPTRVCTDLGCPALEGSGAPAGGGWPGRGGSHGPSQLETRSTRGVQGSRPAPPPENRAPLLQRTHQVGMPAADKGPGRGSQAGATARPEPFWRGQPRGRARSWPPTSPNLAGGRCPVTCAAIKDRSMVSLLPRLLPPALESPLLLLPVQPLAQLAGSGPSGEHAPLDARGGGGANLTSPCETARSEPARRPRLPLRSRLRTAVGPVGGAGRGGSGTRSPCT